MIITSSVKHIPEWFPGAHFQTEARIWRPTVFEMLHKPFNYVKSGMVRLPFPFCCRTQIVTSGRGSGASIRCDVPARRDGEELSGSGVYGISRKGYTWIYVRW